MNTDALKEYGRPYVHGNRFSCRWACRRSAAVGWRGDGRLEVLLSSCAELHDGPPLNYGTLAPVYWNADFADQQGSVLGEEQCVIAGEHFFVRARLVLPITDTDGEFDWGVWVSLSEASFHRMSAVWDNPERVEEPPYFGWLSTALPLYEPTTVNLETKLHI
ncbi:DUF2199 domain-containing protein [Nocardia sp. NPDC047654]|uniref:DUF2199 domain-containing protein n=1 Tax=Nocardia sp. NPDC047654 TaxID=3364314 RepID=UPI003710EAF6